MQAQGRRWFGFHRDRDRPADGLLEAPEKETTDPNQQEVVVRIGQPKN
jgi:hypothetical protein